MKKSRSRRDYNYRFERGVKVLKKMGRENLMLNQKAISEEMYEMSVGHLFGERQTVRAQEHRPARAGVLAEEVWSVRDRKPYFEPGTMYTFDLDMGTPARTWRLVVEHPASDALQTKVIGDSIEHVEARRPAAADTPYEIASITKTLSSTVLLQLVEQGRVNLEDPVSKYGIYIKRPGVIRVKHLLGHTSEREPGSLFLYNGGRYKFLQKVIERASGRPFAELMADAILNPLEMSDSAPFYLLDQPAYQHIRTNLSKPYGYDRSYFTVVFNFGRLCQYRVGPGEIRHCPGSGSPDPP